MISRWLPLLCLLSLGGTPAEGRRNTKDDVFEMTTERLWPMPQEVTAGDDVNEVAYLVSKEQWDWFVSGFESEVVEEALDRYLDLLYDHTPPKSSVVAAAANVGAASLYQLSGLEIYVLSADETLQLGFDEEYTLSISVVSDASKAVLTANTCYGVLRGLETFSQLVNNDFQIPGLPIVIHDYPRFPWRGLMIDTSRHYITLDLLRRTLDAMSYAKFNTFHWHIVDAQAFPLEVKNYPLLHEEGSYDHPYTTYTQEDIEDLVAYAKLRGIRVVMEVDTPGHARSWGYGYPELIVRCPPTDDEWMDATPLDPSKEFTYEVIQNVFHELASITMDTYFHIGGDEVVYSCWNSSESLREWAFEEMGFEDWESVENYFIEKGLDFLRKDQRRGVVWQEVFDHGGDIGLDTIVQVWLDRYTLRTSLEVGQGTLLSQGWYLDQQRPGEDRYRFQDSWMDFYLNEPYEGLDDLDEETLSKLYGGETCAWTEQMDDSNLETQIWPRAGAVAERLYSRRDLMDLENAELRLSFFRCHLWRRGVRAGPIDWPDHCKTTFYPQNPS